MSQISFRQSIGASIGALLLAVAMLVMSAMSVAETRAAGDEKYQAGIHYDLLPQPVRTRDATKIEVVELFWYGCPHCYHFEPLVKQWKKTLSDDVDFWRSPAMWNPRMKIHAQAFFTAESLGVLDKLHNPLFTSLVVERKRLDKPEEIEDLFASYGVDREAFRKTFNSFGIVSQVKQADARARSYRISGTPELVVNGKYRISAGKAGGQEEMLQVADFLIKKERKATLAEAQ